MESTDDNPENEIHKNIGGRLRWSMIAIAGTMTEYSFQTRIPLRMLSRYASGDSLPSTESLLRLYESGISINWLLSGDGCGFWRTIPDLELCCGADRSCRWKVGPYGANRFDGD